MTDHELLRLAARRASADAFFLASALLAYARAEGLDEAALAAYLGCAPADLPALLLCRRPAGDAATFRADARRIAERFRIDATRLVEAIRLAEAVEVLGGPGHAGDAGFLAAARDRDPEGAEEP